MNNLIILIIYYRILIKINQSNFSNIIKNKKEINECVKNNIQKHIQKQQFIYNKHNIKCNLKKYHEFIPIFP